jgi:hypothetical protein
VFCTQCGKELVAEGVAYCAYCGASVAPLAGTPGRTGDGQEVQPAQVVSGVLPPRSTVGSGTHHGSRASLLGLGVGCAFIALLVGLAVAPKALKAVWSVVALNPASLSGVYDVTLTPDQAGGQGERWQLVVNMQSPNGGTVPFSASMVGSDGMGVNGQSTYATVRPGSGGVSFRATFSILIITYAFEGTISANGSMSGRYTESSVNLFGPSTTKGGSFSGSRRSPSP